MPVSRGHISTCLKENLSTYFSASSVINYARLQSGASPTRSIMVSARVVASNRSVCRRKRLFGAKSAVVKNRDRHRIRLRMISLFNCIRSPKDKYRNHR
jgi:hypothetical protein